MSAAIYGLCCPVSGGIRYIGKSIAPVRRFKAHIYLSRRRRTHRDCWIDNLICKGLKPELVILRKLAADEDWAAAERRAIAEARLSGARLTNLTDGGEGAPLTPEGRVKKVAAMRRPDTRAKMSAAAKARWADPEQAAAGRAANAGDEKRKRLSERAKQRATPEYRAMMSARSKAAWADREKRARIEAGITPEVRQRVGEASRRFWATSPNRDACLNNLKARQTRGRRKGD